MPCRLLVFEKFSSFELSSSCLSFKTLYSLTTGNISDCVPSCNETYYTTKLSQSTLHAPSLLNQILNDNLEKRFRTANLVSLRADPRQFMGFVERANKLRIAIKEFYDVLKFISSDRQYAVYGLVKLSLETLTNHVNNDFSFLREQYESLKADYTLSYKAIRDSLKNNMIQLRSLSVNNYQFWSLESDHKDWADRTESTLKGIINTLWYIRNFEKNAMRNLSLQLGGIKKIPNSYYSMKIGLSCGEDLDKMILNFKGFHNMFTMSTSGSESEIGKITSRLQMIYAKEIGILKCLNECGQYIDSMHSYLDESMKSITLHETIGVNRDSVNKGFAEFEKHIEKWKNICSMVDGNRNSDGVFNIIEDLLMGQNESKFEISTQNILKYSFDFTKKEVIGTLESTMENIFSGIINQFSGFFQKLATLDAYYNRTDLKISSHIKNLSIWKMPTINNIGEFCFELSEEQAQNLFPTSKSFGRLVEEETLTSTLEHILGKFKADLKVVIDKYKYDLSFYKSIVDLAVSDLNEIVTDKFEKDKIGNQFIR